MLDKNYWEERYANELTGWDAGSITTPIKDYVDQLEQKDLKILIPGAGNAHEAIYLQKKGFTNIFVCDWAETPLQNLLAKATDFPKEQLIQDDFFNLEEGEFDLIIEQTFFCALPPTRRVDYVQKMAALLKPGGQLVGLLFNFPLQESGPPFGGSLKEYHVLFPKAFPFFQIEDCYNSIKPRKGSEYFFIAQK